MYSRPTPDQTDEDLIRLQEEFVQQNAAKKIKLAATVVSEKRDEKRQVIEEAGPSDISDQLANTFEAIPENSNLGIIVEKSPQHGAIPRLNFNMYRGFPMPKRRDAASGKVEGEGSIFAKQFKRMKKSEVKKPVEEKSLPSQSFVLMGHDKDEIHDENISKIKSMSEEEILEEREQLLNTMNPAIITYLQSIRPEKVETRNPTIQEQNEAAQNMEIEEIETASEILSTPQSDKWLNFTTIETTKLAWMKDVEMPKIEKNKSFEARFDFEGWLLPYSENEITEKSRILYHHGEEAGRPGYTLQELFQLSRSNVLQQKIVALNTIAKILELHSTGVYDDVIDLPVEQIFFVLRFCLDDNIRPVFNSSIKAMRNLFYSKVDETCLDSLLGFGLGQVQPTLAIDNDSDDDRVNDQQLAETNLVKCLARTEILTRIRYVIKTMRPTTETIVFCMDVLIRLIRDSEFILNKVCTCEDLISSILENFIPISTKSQKDSIFPYYRPLLQAVKFFRILASRDRHILPELIEKHNVMNSITSYLTNECYFKNTNGLKLQTESLHLWAVLVHYGLGVNFFNAFQPKLVKLLTHHLENTDLDKSTTYVRQGHAAALLVLIGGCCKHVTALLPHWGALLLQCLSKWVRQFLTLTDFECGKLQIIAAIFYCLEHLTKIMSFSEDIGKIVILLLKSEGFRVVTETILNGSMLFNNYETHKTSANLKTVEAAAWYTSEHVVPILQSNSPLPFLSSLSNFIETSSNVNLKLAFLQNKNITKYLDELRKLDKFYLTSHWFTRVESNLIMNILKCSIIVRRDLDTRSFYEVAVKCLSIFTSEQKPNIEYILKYIVFSPQFYPSEVLLKNMSIQQGRDSVATSLNNLDEILAVYTQVLGLKIDVPTFEDNLCLDLNKGTVIPIDWIYTPIIVLYSNQQQNKQNLTEEEQVLIIRNCLRWVLIYENYFPELATAVNPTDRFCRIACVFLGSDNLFLIPEIHTLLELCLHNILKNEREIKFSKEIQGLSSFQDFYTQLLEQYQGVSYGDVLFGNFILVPLRQRHSLKWRKTLWSEYLGVVEIFNVTPEQSLCGLDAFLEPNEEDVSLLKCYRRAIVGNSVRKHSILYSIAKHHVDEYAAKIKKIKNKI